ncbi:probable tubulin polyglutamylase TTLL9 isoform X4 [Mustela putorius furo]|uniref:Tubulin--tyrosine ligase-like protein 9 n=1 Tax=Mustela putorius furo TaxID=9669 RepID=A0A8U0V4Y6_MUSPF|nr:probable tubulin polyglutamylase TTLL9 isoform X4 [Mustela putorius furo]
MSRPKNQNYKGHGLSKGKEREQRASIRFKTTLMNTLMDVLRHRPGWVEVKDEGEWDFYWCDVSWLRENFDHTYMDEHVRISHFRNHYELTRKNYMVKNLKRFRKQLEREAGKLEAAKCDFFPKTFEMPCEYHLFVEEFRKNPGITWIMKPVARSQGKGIFLFRRLKDIMDWRKGTAGKKLTSLEAPPARSTVNPSGSHDARSSDDQKDEIPVENYVAQRYIENPYLIGGRKFDLRVYVLVMSMSTSPMLLCKRHLLTTTQRRAASGCSSASVSTSRPSTGLRRWRRSSVIWTTSLSRACRACRRWLLEVNASPSLTASSQEDYELKTCLLEDTLHVVDMEARLTGREKRVGGFDLMWNDGPVSREEGPPDLSGMGNFVANTHLVGCFLNLKRPWIGTPGWLSWLSSCLRLRS